SDPLHGVCISYRTHTTKPSVNQHDNDEKYDSGLIRDRSSCQSGNSLSNSYELFKQIIPQTIKHEYRCQDSDSFRLIAFFKPLSGSNQIILLTQGVKSWSE